MQKLLTALATVAIVAVCFVLLPTEVKAAEIASGACGENLIWSKDDVGNLTISGTGCMTNYYILDEKPWGTDILTVIIEPGVTSIGEAAFSYCDSLTSVTIPDSVTSIGDDAFYECSGLTSITIPDSVTSIGDGAFINCSNLTSITIPDSVTSIGHYAFEGCTGLTSITIPESVTSIGNGVFIECWILSDLYIEDLTAWSRISFGGSCGTDIENLYVNGTLVTELIIPDSVTSVGNYVFCNLAGLTSITIPDSVTSIGDWAFYGCSNLTSITIPDSVTSIGEAAFSYCYSLTSITIPDSIKMIKARTFQNCSQLNAITIPTSVTAILADAMPEIRHILYTGAKGQWDAVNKVSNAFSAWSVVTYNYTEGTEYHTYDNGTITKEANCKEEGVKTFACTVCSETTTEPIAKLTSHTWDNGTVTKEATCKEEGINTYTCTICSDRYTESIAKLADHNWNNGTPNGDGTFTYTCTTCGETRVDGTPTVPTTVPPTTAPTSVPPESGIESTTGSTQPTESTPITTDLAGTDATQPGNAATTPSAPGETKEDNTVIIFLAACATSFLLGAGSATAAIILWKKKH